jgi:alanyl-tRNA synthetase
MTSETTKRQSRPQTREQLVESYLGFFERRGHLRLDSGSLVPEGDESVLFTSAGMQPLKPYFLGQEPPCRRLTSVQRCLRTKDVELVGQTDRHLTYFEMLGNFSLGDYFKREAVESSWEYTTEVLGFEPEHLWASYFGGDEGLKLPPDEETLELWREFLPEERLVPLGRADNFWTLGQGPSGPCSEIYYDRGPEHGCDRQECHPGCDCERFLEFWNLVFTQYNLQEGLLSPLGRSNVDTGLGLERTLLLLEGVESVFDTDSFRPLQCLLDGSRSGRILKDHVRSISLLMLEGVSPSNVGRGYVLRRLLRRSVLHCLRLGVKLEELVILSSERLRRDDPELERELPLDLLREEERSFKRTLERGQRLLERMQVVGPEEVFRLYETHGLPVEVTLELLGERGRELDLGELELLRQEHKRVSRA